MLADDRVDRRQPQAAAGGFRGEVRIKDPREVFRRDPRAVVADGNAHVIARAQRGHRPLPADGHVVRADLQHAAFRRSLHGVDDEIVDDLVDLTPVQLRQPDVGREPELAAQVGAVQRELDAFAHQRCYRLDAPFGRGALGKGQELPRQVRRVDARLLDRRQGLRGTGDVAAC